VAGSNEDNLGVLLGKRTKVHLGHEVAEVTGMQAVLGGCEQQTRVRKT